MTSIPAAGTSRRNFLRAASVTAMSAVSSTILAAERPPVTNPRATSGDPIEPDWQERLTVSVGTKNADLVGSDHRVIQAAVDYVTGLGGGTVHVLPGTYRMRNAVYLRCGVRITGSGEESILIKEASVQSELAANSDWYDQEITLADASGFRVGDGVCLVTKNASHGGTDVVRRTLVARSGNRFKLDRAPRKNFWISDQTRVSTLFPILDGDHISDVSIENITIDGNKDQNENLNGNYAGCIFLQDCNRIRARGVTTRNYNGDGISWQICHDVVVQDCHSHDNAGLGLHPGSGSQRPIMRNNRLVGNSIGLFFCWGIHYGLAQGNTIEDSIRYGISIGHHDTENLITENTVRRSGQVGVLFRAARSREFAPHRNRLLKNLIEDSGAADGIGVDVQGETEGVTIAENRIVETRAPEKRIGIRLGAQTGEIQLKDNRIAGVATAILDLH